MRAMLAGMALVLAAGQEGAIELDLRNKENVVASRLEGTWRTQKDLSQRLAGQAVEMELAVRYDRAALPDEALKRLAAKGKVARFQVYAIGRIAVRGKDHPFFLTSLNGNPHVVYLRERDGDPFGDAESFNVMLAPGKDRKDDLLFVGGDFNNQPFLALERVETASSK